MTHGTYKWFCTADLPELFSDNKGLESLTPCLAAKKAAAGSTDVFVFSCTKTGQYEARQCQMFV